MNINPVSSINFKQLIIDTKKCPDGLEQRLRLLAAYQLENNFYLFDAKGDELMLVTEKSGEIEDVATLSSNPKDWPYSNNKKNN